MVGMDSLKGFLKVAVLCISQFSSDNLKFYRFFFELHNGCLMQPAKISLRWCLDIRS